MKFENESKPSYRENLPYKLRKDKTYAVLYGLLDSSSLSPCHSLLLSPILPRPSLFLSVSLIGWVSFDRSIHHGRDQKDKPSGRDAERERGGGSDSWMRGSFACQLTSVLFFPRSFFLSRHECQPVQGEEKTRKLYNSLEH